MNEEGEAYYLAESFGLFLDCLDFLTRASPWELLPTFSDFLLQPISPEPISLLRKHVQPHTLDIKMTHIYE